MFTTPLGLIPGDAVTVAGVDLIVTRVQGLTADSAVVYGHDMSDPAGRLTAVLIDPLTEVWAGFVGLPAHSMTKPRHAHRTDNRAPLVRMSKVNHYADAPKLTSITV